MRMWIRFRERPTGRRLFRVCAAASVSAVLFGGLFLLACWAAADFDATVGRELTYLGLLLVGILGAGVLVYYPWSLRWAEANGCKPDAETGTAPDRGGL
jgi:hypothetical protein